MRCPQPGCPGTIEDGYCNVCGLPPGSGADAASSAAAATPQQSAGAQQLSHAQQTSNRQPGQPQLPDPLQQAAQALSGPAGSIASVLGLSWAEALERSGQRSPLNQQPAASRTAMTPPPSNPPRQVPHQSSDGMGVASGPCPQPGCSGTIVDGYCNVCGRPPVVVAPGSVLGTDMHEHVSTLDLGMVLIGSALAGSDSQARPRADYIANRRTRIGAGITQVPPAPPVDPAKAIMTDPVVPQRRRNCPKCGSPVGQGDEQNPQGTAVGVCPNCGQPFDFRPSIKAGEIIAGQYEVAGCLAYGGMGWIYLARDRNVSGRWVVLKGLLNVNDEDASMAAKMEKEFLAQVEHPLIVEIYNFVEHGDARYIVMEFVPGRSITDLLKQRREENDGVINPLPVDWALAYIIEILPAFSYLHERGLLYCDFKPDNLMQVEDSLKLIDLGAVRWMDDQESPIFGTVGYQAPEVAEVGPSLESDIYTIGRAILVMCADFPEYRSEFVDSLPPANRLPVLARNDSLYRLLQRACAPVPEDRFQSAEEMRLQSLGVLREVVGRQSGGAALTSQVSTLFHSISVLGEDEIGWQELPQLKADGSDPMNDWLTALTVDDPKQRMRELNRAPQRTPAVVLAQIEICLRAGNLSGVAKLTNEMLKDDPWDWRAIWMQALAEVQAGHWANAVPAFNTVYAQVPGELAPKFALAVACERAGQPAAAEELFTVCVSADAGYVTPSAFGMARVRSARDDLKGALDALALVPPTSRGYGEARLRRARIGLERGQNLEDMEAALSSVRTANLDPATTARLEVQIFERALPMVQAGQGGRFMRQLGGMPATERNVRTQLEQAYRDLARWTDDVDERNRLLGNADSKRRWSLF